LSIDNKDRYTDVEIHVFINLNKGKKPTYEMFSTTNIQYIKQYKPRASPEEKGKQLAL
jgi:hypothetical protein